MSWLPPPSVKQEERLERLWIPPALEQRVSPEELAQLHYVWVDEIEGGAIGLVVCAWPHIDAFGRLRFLGGRTTLGANAERLEGFLTRHREPNELGQRPLRVGDAFAAGVMEAALNAGAPTPPAELRMDPLLNPADWIRTPIYDITADARDAAKTSFYAAVTPTLEPEQAARLAALSHEQT